MARRREVPEYLDFDKVDNAASLKKPARPKGGDPVTFSGQVAETVVNAVEFLMDLFCIFG